MNTHLNTKCMRKTALAGILLSFLSLNALAEETSPFYTQFDLGYSQLNFTTLGQKYKQGNFNQRLSLGYNLTPSFDFAIDITKLNDVEVSSKQKINSYTTAELNPQVKAKSVGVKLTYHEPFQDIEGLSSYAGLGLSYNFIKIRQHVKTNSVLVNKTIYREYDNLKNYRKTSFILLAGLNYKLSNNVSLNANIEYEQLGKFSNVRVKQFGGKLGLKYQF